MFNSEIPTDSYCLTVLCRSLSHISVKLNRNDWLILRSYSRSFSWICAVHGVRMGVHSLWESPPSSFIDCICAVNGPYCVGNRWLISLCLAFINPKLWIRSPVVMALVIYEWQLLFLLLLSSWGLSDGSLSSCSLSSRWHWWQSAQGCVKCPISAQVKSLNTQARGVGAAFCHSHVKLFISQGWRAACHWVIRNLHKRFYCTA